MIEEIGGKRVNVGGIVPRGDSVGKIFEYGQRTYNEDQWSEGPDRGVLSGPGAYGRQPNFMKEKKWTTKPQMYNYFLENPEELKNIDGTVRMKLTKEIKKHARSLLPKGGRGG